MSLFGSLFGDVEDESFFGSQMSHMRHMNNMMNSLLSDPFSMLGGGPLAIGGPRHGNSLMPFMPQMPPLNRLFGGGNFLNGPMGVGSSFSRSTIVMSSGPNGQPQVISSSSSTKYGPNGIKETRNTLQDSRTGTKKMSIDGWTDGCLKVISSSSSTKYGPNGIKETRNTLQDSRTGTKKMSIGHHIGERAHLIEREQNYYSGDAEERQEFINIDEEEAEEFDREFQTKAGAAQMRSREAIAGRRSPQLLALTAPPAPAPAPVSPPGPSVRDVYGTAHPKRQRHKHHNRHRHADN
ncbi:Myeloid leukemia factor [Papilio machaon]|uniref:Myeloid leukemia factor n=1 Tax=Papilio machaon TaxID=76193 RepID=A0A194QQN4_PAPMA|nr:Myeloid leukemia factor [Papilio machaon]